MKNTFTSAQKTFREAESCLDTALENLESASIEKFDNKIRLNGLDKKNFVLMEIDYHSPSVDVKISLMTELPKGIRSINGMAGAVEYSFSAPVSELDRSDVVEIINEFLLKGVVLEEKSKALTKRLPIPSS